jgi:hypothetical protein
MNIKVKWRWLQDKLIDLIMLSRVKIDKLEIFKLKIIRVN